MFKKKALVVLVSALALTNVAQALGLGDIELNSNLNEPLDAEINLRQLRGLTAGEILPTLASNDAFQRAGVERSFFLSNIQFQVTESENGEMVISLSTRQPVREPFLNFLVEVNWPGGRLLKEYTLLLDPPVFDTASGGDSLAIDTPSAVADETSELTTTTRASSRETTSETQPAAEVQPREDDLPPGEYRVQRNDTLWGIANDLPAGSGYSTQQVMLAIQDLNPEAFLNSNINRLKAGSVLNLPSEAQISARTFQQAVNEVRMQNEGMAPRLRPVVDEQPETEVQLSATESTSSALPEGEGERDPDGYLEVAPDQDSKGASAGGEPGANAEIERLQNELAVAAELNDQFQRENAEMESRLNQLEEQIAIMQRLLNVQGGDAAALQQQLASREAAEDGAAQAGAGPEAGAGQDAAESATSETAEALATEEAATEEPATQQGDGAAVTDDSNASRQAEPATQPQPSSEQQPSSAAQQPAQPQPTADPGVAGFVREYTTPVSNWVLASVPNMIITGAGLLILLLLPSFIRSRMNKADDEDTEADTLTAAGAGDRVLDTDFDDDLLRGFDDEAPLTDLDDTYDERTADAIMEAEMYMAYQKYDQAEEKLKSAFAEDPGRADIGLKLLEVYAETGNANAFDELEQRLSLTGSQQDQVRELRERMPMATGSSDHDFSMELDDDMDLDFGGEDNEEPAAYTASLDELEQDLTTESGRYDLGEFESSSFEETDARNRSQSKAAVADADDLDFSLDLDDLELPETNPESDRDADTGLDFDLEDLELETEPPAGATSPAAEKPQEAGLDFRLDEDELGDLDTDFDFNFDETEKPSEPELPTLDTEEEGEFDFTSLEDSPARRAETDELPTDDGLTSTDKDDTLDIDMESEGGVEEATELDSEAIAALDDTDLRDLADALPGGTDLDEDEFDFLSGSDEASTKLDLARAYIEMDDREGARDILEEVVSEGTDEQRRQAKALMDKI